MDKAKIIVSHILKQVSNSKKKPLFVAFSGPQGCGKTTLTNSLVEIMSSNPHNLRVVTLSMDDLYLPNGERERLASSYPSNKLLSHRGHAGTHDVQLGKETLSALANGKDTPIPLYDKSMHGGKGDRRPLSEWKVESPPYDIVLFEGWCMGFLPLSKSELKERYENGRNQHFLKHSIKDLEFINEHLAMYEQEWYKPYISTLVLLRAEDISYVYDWRLQQEVGTRLKSGGEGMTDQQVVEFVDGYMPGRSSQVTFLVLIVGYEIWSDTVSRGEFWKGKSLELVLDKQRAVTKVVEF